jgi:SAM-dependent methyltransferase
MMTHEYTEEFFRALRDGAQRSAAEIVPLVLDLIQPRSVVDVGCGTGTWLMLFSRHGVADYLGVDAFTPAGLLEIPRERFVEADLTRPLALGRRFDLAVSLETAEHLPEFAAKDFVESLTRLAPAVLFSAAIPGQGGTGHLNEQWPEYWARLFADHGFEPIDVLRPRLWNNERVEVWYVQNTLLYVEVRRRAEFPRLAGAIEACGAPLAVVHPRLFLERHRTLSEMVQGQVETRARMAVLSEALAAERETGRSSAEEIERLRQVLADQRAQIEQYLAKSAEYRAHEAEARSQVEASRQEAQRYRAEAERREGEIARWRREAEALGVDVSRYRFMAEPRNMSLWAYLRALPRVVSGALRWLAS